MSSESSFGESLMDGFPVFFIAFIAATGIAAMWFDYTGDSKAKEQYAHRIEHGGHRDDCQLILPKSERVNGGSGE